MSGTGVTIRGRGMTNGDMMIAIYGIVDVEVNERSVRLFPKDGGQLWVTRDWWNAEYKEPTIECVQKIDKSAMMHEIYMAGVNMAGEYQGCWVRFKEIEKIVDRYVR